MTHKEWEAAIRLVRATRLSVERGIEMQQTALSQVSWVEERIMQQHPSEATPDALSRLEDERAEAIELLTSVLHSLSFESEDGWLHPRVDGLGDALGVFLVRVAGWRRMQSPLFKPSESSRGQYREKEE